MADGNKDFRRRFGRRGRDRSASREESRPARPELPPISCAICEKQIFDLSNAIATRDGSGSVHFDCALASLNESERLEPNEKISYIGRGAFAVIEFKDKSHTTFIIKRRIPWEKEGEKFDWRKILQQRMGI